MKGALFCRRVSAEASCCAWAHAGARDRKRIISSAANFDLPTSDWPTRDSAETGRRSRRIGCKLIGPGPFRVCRFYGPRGALLANLTRQRAREREVRDAFQRHDCELKADWITAIQ